MVPFSVFTVSGTLLGSSGAPRGASGELLGVSVGAKMSSETTPSGKSARSETCRKCWF